MEAHNENKDYQHVTELGIQLQPGETFFHTQMRFILCWIRWIQYIKVQGFAVQSWPSEEKADACRQPIIKRWQAIWRTNQFDAVDRGRSDHMPLIWIQNANVLEGKVSNLISNCSGYKIPNQNVPRQTRKQWEWMKWPRFWRRGNLQLLAMELHGVLQEVPALVQQHWDSIWILEGLHDWVHWMSWRPNCSSRCWFRENGQVVQHFLIQRLLSSTWDSYTWTMWSRITT